MWDIWNRMDGGYQIFTPDVPSTIAKGRLFKADRLSHATSMFLKNFPSSSFPTRAQACNRFYAFFFSFLLLQSFLRSSLWFTAQLGVTSLVGSSGLSV